LRWRLEQLEATTPSRMGRGGLKIGKKGAGARAGFPILVQQQFSVSKHYEMYATPFALLVHQRGVIVSKALSTTVSTSTSC
jgi:hypothetical protein